jgi:hypothetical protein
MKRWSKLQREIYKIIDPAVRLQVHCVRYRMDSERGSTDLPRYWITLGREVIWDYPRDFIDRPHPGRNPPKWYPYGTDIPDISGLIRDYIDTPRTELLSKRFAGDHWGIVNILRAADRRFGQRGLLALGRKTRNSAARRVIEARFHQKRLNATN